MLSDILFLSYAALIAALVLGFAHLVWLFSVKESGTTKLIGQVIAWVIVVATVLLLVLGGYHGRGWMKKSGMMWCPMGGQMMMRDYRTMMKDWDMMMKDKGMMETQKKMEKGKMK
ncbi:hypothetical protein A2625_04800 [candidate division WOR-1 bacterium RIFCSPHIGHO2_01_FULL_53_15]|uniref:Uncharacterized protein n=1 Tax=candidate division WOR-1 bacterium RIFCSPHIGHO2_01_FULL_53_15 TaxID=1802564 RepID=A0A1F4Q244_UNCSA|nr:MAG: hypothetical protein A2625_04800 [candidate division WOR-1 bacterium RIFCSPHIGHO2_01_FULL_53_15]OGC13199.1 MAG: hypothetical protein A3D23_01055 [candidate division WOR-1 bacterium RIFCSPHIGHO2_02_FULL_53_26]